MARVIMNGREYSGRSVVVSKNRIFVDGVETTPDAKEIKIEVIGDLDNLSVDCCKEVTVDGDVVNSLRTTSGDVSVKGKVGSVSTVSGDIKCKDITGDVKTISGDVECNAILGNITGSKINSTK